MKFYPVTDTDTIPALGLGTWKSTSKEVAQAITKAIEIGYRHIDCAPIYQNEKDVGEALETARAAGSIDREELWITSKLWNNAHAKKHVRPALEKTLRELRLDYLDLFLIHWPVHFRPGVIFPRRPEDFLPPDAIPVMETWQEMERLVKKGLCRFIGVCNFNLARLKDLYSQATIKPLMNQIEMHPYLQQEPMLDFCKENNILLTAYSPLGSADRPAAIKKDNEPSLLDHQTISAIARNNNITPGQVLLSWGLARGTVVIPKSVNPDRLAENFRAADINLADTDIQAIEGLELNYRFVDGSFFQMPGSPYSVDDIWGEE